MKTTCQVAIYNLNPTLKDFAEFVNLWTNLKVCWMLRTQRLMTMNCFGRFGEFIRKQPIMSSRQLFNWTVWSWTQGCWGFVINDHVLRYRQVFFVTKKGVSSTQYTFLCWFLLSTPLLILAGMCVSEMATVQRRAPNSNKRWIYSH